jgi:hypothetical protein
MGSSISLSNGFRLKYGRKRRHERASAKTREKLRWFISTFSHNMDISLGLEVFLLGFLCHIVFVISTLQA